MGSFYALRQVLEVEIALDIELRLRSLLSSIFNPEHIVVAQVISLVRLVKIAVIIHDLCWI